MKYIHLLVWLVGIILVCVALVTALLYYDYYVGIGAPSHPGFTGYRPTVLPNNVKLTGQSLVRNHTVGLDDWSFVYQLKLSSTDFTISETQKYMSEPSSVSCQSYGNVCYLYQTPKGHVYRVWYGEYKNKAFGLEIELIESNTHITLSVNDAVVNQYLQTNWSPMIDSMQMIDLKHMPYVRRNFSGVGG